MSLGKKKMKGLLLNGPGDIALTELDMPEVAADEVLVKVVACGVCNATDLKSDAKDHFGKDVSVSLEYDQATPDLPQAQYGGYVKLATYVAPW